MKWELASADGKAEEVADFAALQATVAEHGITLLSWGSDTGAAFEACKAERGYVASDEDELSEAKVGAEQLTGILGAVTKLHAFRNEAFHYVKDGACIFTIPLGEGGAAGSLTLTCGAGDVVILSPGTRHRFALTEDKRVVMCGAYKVDPKDADPKDAEPEFFE